MVGCFPRFSWRGVLRLGSAGQSDTEGVGEEPSGKAAARRRPKAKSIDSKHAEHKGPWTGPAARRALAHPAFKDGRSVDSPTLLRVQWARRASLSDSDGDFEEQDVRLKHEMRQLLGETAVPPSQRPAPAAPAPILAVRQTALVAQLPAAPPKRRLPAQHFERVPPWRQMGLTIDIAEPKTALGSGGSRSSDEIRTSSAVAVPFHHSHSSPFRRVHQEAALLTQGQTSRSRARPQAPELGVTSNHTLRDAVPVKRELHSKNFLSSSPGSLHEPENKRRHSRPRNPARGSSLSHGAEPPSGQEAGIDTIGTIFLSSRSKITADRSQATFKAAEGQRATELRGKSRQASQRAPVTELCESVAQSVTAQSATTRRASRDRADQLRVSWNESPTQWVSYSREKKLNRWSAKYSRDRLAVEGLC